MKISLALLGLLFLTMPAAVQAQSDDGYTYSINASNENTVTITGYTGPGGAVSIPSTISNLTVTSIGSQAFVFSAALTSVTIPDSVTSIGDNAFNGCPYLTSVTIPGSLTTINWGAFLDCSALTNVTISNGVKSIGVTSVFDNGPFENCTSLASLTIPRSVNTFGNHAFFDCPSLTGIYFMGNAPATYNLVFAFHDPVTAYYLPGTTGWSNFSVATGVPAVLWKPLIQAGGPSFGVESNQFGFNINWASGQTVVVEASTNLADSVWIPLQTNTLASNSFFFSEPLQANIPGRYYRIRSP